MKRLLLAAFVMGSVSLVHSQPVDPRAQYEDAYQAMVNGEFGRAASGFAAAAAMTDDPELRSAANQLSRLASDLATRNARLMFGTPALSAPRGAAAYPPSAGDEPPRVEAGSNIAVSEDDARDGGRSTFVATTTIASLYTGVVLLDLLDIDDVRTGTLIVMGTTAAGVIGSIYGTKGRTMTGAMADSWSLGLTVGAANALLLSSPVGLTDGNNVSEKIQTTTILSAWGVATAGLLFADHYRPTRAQVSVTGTFGMMGVATTLLSLAIIQPDNLTGDASLTLTAVGLNASLVAGGVFASKLDWSQSRARYVGLSALLGGLAGIGSSLLLFADAGGGNVARLAAGITLGGMWGGFALGTHLTRDMAPDYRFRIKPMTAQTTVAPTRINEAPGLAVVGAF